MHSTNLPPAGKGVDLEEKPDGFYLRSKIVEPGAVKLCQEGAYTAYSIGIKNHRAIRDNLATKGRIIDGIVCETSLVDFPANTTCKFTIVKRAGADMLGEPEWIESIDSDVSKVGNPHHDAHGRFTSAANAGQGLSPATGTPGGMAHGVGITEKEPKGGGKGKGSGGKAGSKGKQPKGKAPAKTGKKPSQTHANVRSQSRVQGSKPNPHVSSNQSSSHGSGSRIGHVVQGSKPPSGRGNTAHVGAASRVKNPPSTGKHGDHQSAHAPKAPTTQHPASGGGGAMTTPSPGTNNSNNSGTSVANFHGDMNIQGGGQWAKVADADIGKREFSDDQRKDLADSGKAMPDGSFPIENESDLENAIHSVGRAKDYDAARRHITSRAKDMGKTDMLPEDWPGSTAEKFVSGYTTKRLHDLWCPAFSQDTVHTLYPSLVKDGVAFALGPQAIQLVYQMLQEEVMEDGGSGEEADDIVQLAHLYMNFVRNIKFFLDAEARELLDLDDYAIAPEIYWDAKADLFKGFLTANGFKDQILGQGNGPGYPDFVTRPSDEVGPQRYRRPYIADGHAQMSAKSAESDAVDSRTSRDFYSNDQRNRVRDMMMSLHDGLATIFPELCPMDPIEKAESVDGFHVVENPGSGKATPESEPMDDMHENDKPERKDLVEVGSVLGESKSVAAQPDLIKAFTQQVDQAIKAAIGDLPDQVNRLSAMYEDLASQPDPKSAPYRGVAGTRPIEKSTQADEVQKRVDAEVTKRRKVEIDMYRGWLRDAADPAQREYASRKLEELITS